MKLDGAVGLARRGRLYPSIIVHGGAVDERLLAAEQLARATLCEAVEEERPCGRCRHCRRIEVAADSESFHPDFQVLRRDLKTSTSVAATKAFSRICQQTPFEARGQVMVVAEAESLSAEAADALLKVLEEPPARAPRNFLLLAPSQADLLPTLRSRSWSIYLGPSEQLPAEAVDRVAAELSEALGGFRRTGSTLYLLAAAAALESAGGWEDLRSQRPWSLAASAVKRVAAEAGAPDERRRLLALAEELLGAVEWRLRNVPPQRLVEGLVSRHLG